MDTFRIVVTKIPKNKEKEVFEILFLLIKKGLVELEDIHMIDEKLLLEKR